MKDVIAKKYAKAIEEKFQLDDIEAIYEVFSGLSSVFEDSKIKALLFSPDITNEDKEKLIIDSISKANSTELNNFIKILISNNRLDLIPYIADELKSIISNKTKSYDGVVYSNEDIDKDILLKLSDGLSSKFDSKISLTYKKSDFNGIKVDVDGLGVEIDFSKNRINSQIVEYILQAI